MLNIERYIGIPYEWNGRSFEKCDCYGLVILYYREELGIELTDYDHRRQAHSEFKNSEYLIENAHKEFVKVERPKAHDVILIRNKSETPNHCGIVLGQRFLHCLEGVGCVTSKISTWHKRAHGIYRHKGLL